MGHVGIETHKSKSKKVKTAIISFQNGRQASYAQRMMNGFSVYGKRLRVKAVKAEPEKPVEQPEVYMSEVSTMADEEPYTAEELYYDESDNLAYDSDLFLQRRDALRETIEPHQFDLFDSRHLVNAFIYVQASEISGDKAFALDFVGKVQEYPGEDLDILISSYYNFVGEMERCYAEQSTASQ